MPDGDPETRDPSRLSRMLTVNGGGAGVWRPEEMGSILQHQLSAPVETDLGSEPGASPMGQMTFGQLLHEPHPPLEMLTRMKRFAKACTLVRDGPLPPEVATVLYFASIAVARLRCGQRITELNDQALKKGMEWAQAQTWVDPATRSIFHEAAAKWAAAE